MWPLDYIRAIEWRNNLTSKIIKKPEEEYTSLPQNRGMGKSEQACLSDKLKGFYRDYKNDWVLYINGQRSGIGPVEVLVLKTPYPDIFDAEYDILLKKINPEYPNGLKE